MQEQDYVSKLLKNYPVVMALNQGTLPKLVLSYILTYLSVDGA